jgi:hypothetical protein
VSAARAARALLELDTELAARIASEGSTLNNNYWGHREVVLKIVRECVLGTWTLTLAARAAGMSEQQVVAALLYLEPLRIGSTVVCQGEAQRLFQGLL